MFKNLKLSWKMFLGFACIMILSGVIVLVSLINLKQINALTHQLYTTSFTVSNSCMEIISEINDVGVKMRDIILEENVSDYENEMNECVDNIQRLIGIIEPIFLGNKDLITNLKNDLQLGANIRGEVIKLAKEGSYKAAKDKLLIDYKSIYKQTIESATAVHESSLKTASNFDINAANTGDRAATIIIVLYITTLIVSIIVVFLTIKSISNPIRG